MRQETLCAFPVELFSVSDTGASSSKGACVCAVVALPSRPPKYTLVCYSAQQVTFCVARMNYVDGLNTSLRLLTHESSGHISFSDDTDQRWSVFFTDAAQQTRFLACCGVAFYGLFGAPEASVFSYDVSFPSSSLRLELGDRAHMSFTSYELTEKENMCTIGALGEQRGAAAGGALSSQQQENSYVFQPSASAAQLAQDSFGFEGNVVGMREGDVRVFVVPAGFTTRVADSLTKVSARGWAFVVRLVRVEHVNETPTSAGQAAGSKERAPPSLYAATENRDAGQVSTLSEQALMVVAGTQTSSAASAVPAFLSSCGIPAEHMSVLRKIELGVNTAVATARDVHGVTTIFSQDWHRHMERPKPSLLSNRSLLEQVQRVVQEEETAQRHLEECDSTMQALEARSNELQQRIDRAVSDSKRLLEEKNKVATKAMEERLERERQLVKLKDELRVKEQEREDLQRRAAALRRFIDTSNEELRQLQGCFDVHEIQSKGLVEQISAIQQSLSEERRCSATLASKSASTEEAIRKAQAQHRLADSQLTAARGLAERERLRYLQVMEDERSHRATDAAILRKDIVDALDAREQQYQVDRCRLAEEQFLRGLRDGKAEGRRVAETDLLGHQDELRLNLQRAKTEVETRREEVRRSIESSMALRRTLGNKVAELEGQLASATCKQTHLHYKLSQWQTWCRTARDTVSQHWRALLSYITHPCTQDELLQMMEAVSTAEHESYASDNGDGGSDGTGAPVRVDLQFQLERWRQTRAHCIAQRQRWIWDDMLDLYTKGSLIHFDREWLQPLVVAHDATLEAVAQLYAQQHGDRALFDCCTEEAQERWLVRQEWWLTIHEVEEWLAAQRTAQENLKSEETATRLALWKDYMDGGEAVVQLCASQLRAQVMLLHQEMQARDELVSEEQRRWRLLPEEAQQQWAAACSSARRLFEEEEEATRAGLEAEAYVSYSGLEFQCAYALRAAQKLSRQHTEQQHLLAEETAARQALVREAADAAERLRLAAVTTVSSAEAAGAPENEGNPSAILSSSPTEAVHSASPLRPLSEVTPASPPSSSCSARHTLSPPSPGHPIEDQKVAIDKSAAALLPAAASAPSHGMPVAEPPVDPATVRQQVNLSPRPPPPPAPEITFGFEDLPRAAWADHRRDTDISNPLRDRGLMMTTDIMFSSEPPPLPRLDEADASAEAVSGPSEPCSSGAFHAVATSAASPLPRCSSRAESSAAPTSGITAESDDPPPPLSEAAEVDQQHMLDQRSSSSTCESTSSSLRTSLTSSGKRDGNAAASFTALPLPCDPTERKEEAATDGDPPSSTQRRLPHTFGADSSDIGENFSGNVTSGHGFQQSQTSVPRRTREPTTTQTAARSATKKPKLFDSSSGSEQGE